MSETSPSTSSGYPERTKFQELVSALWPMATSAEVASLTSFEQLQQLASAGILPPEHQQLLNGYLMSLPGYDEPDEFEAKRLHGYEVANYLFPREHSIWEERVKSIYVRETNRAVAITLVFSAITLVLLGGFGYLVYQNPSNFTLALVGITVLAAAFIYRYVVYLPGKRDRRSLLRKGVPQ